MIAHILALDLGKGSLGVSISRSGMFVTPLSNIHFHLGDYNEAISLLKEEIKNEKVEHIVIGLPSYPSGDPCEMTPIVLSFIPLLKEAFPHVDILTQDERYSTVDAYEYMHDNEKTAKKSKTEIDSIAASVILERYLKNIGQF